MANKVYAIIEAFSMQPNRYYIGMNMSDTINRIVLVHHIVLEDISINGDSFQYYVGYSIDGKRLFEYRRESVNVHFEPNE
jgi:hypothetical protein